MAVLYFRGEKFSLEWICVNGMGMLEYPIETVFDIILKERNNYKVGIPDYTF